MTFYEQVLNESFPFVQKRITSELIKHSRSSEFTDFYYYGTFDDPAIIRNIFGVIVMANDAPFRFCYWESCAVYDDRAVQDFAKTNYLYSLNIEYGRSVQTRYEATLRHTCTLVVPKDAEKLEITAQLDGIKNYLKQFNYISTRHYE